VQAQPFEVSLEEIAPYVERFLARQQEMLLTGQALRSVARCSRRSSP
jgi:hypothetical protein